MGPATIETRKTYHAVLSEPKLVVPHSDFATHATHVVTGEETTLPLPTGTTSRLNLVDLASHLTIKTEKNNKKRKREKESSLT